MMGCVTAPPPHEDYTLSYVALNAAKSVQAARYAPGYWHQAEEYYRRAKILFVEREYAEAKKFFINARIAAERAENISRISRQKNGDVL